MGAAEWCQRPVPRRPTGSTQDLGISGLQHWASCLLVGRPLCSPSFFSGPGLGAEWAGTWVRWAWAPTPEAAERRVGMPTAEGSLQPRGLTTAGFLTWTLLCAPLGPGRPPPLSPCGSQTPVWVGSDGRTSPTVPLGHWLQASPDADDVSLVRSV